jgi:FixJ family two-component response regulator
MLIGRVTAENGIAGHATLKDPSTIARRAMESESTVYVVDDDAGARESVVALVGLKGLKARGFTSAEELLDHYDPAMKGCVVADVRMSGMSGLDLLEQLKARKSALPVIIITGYADVPMAVRAMQKGAVTFLEKPCQEQELWQAVQEALALEKSQHAKRKQRTEVEARLATLTEDEIEVFRRLLEGHANKRIASDLDIGLRTVELRRSNIMKKMQATSLPDLVRLAILIEFLKPEG